METPKTGVYGEIALPMSFQHDRAHVHNTHALRTSLSQGFFGFLQKNLLKELSVAKRTVLATTE